MGNRSIDKEASELHIIVKAEKADWNEAQKKTLTKLTKNLEIKGFRKGKVPANIAKEHITDNHVWSEAVGEIVSDLGTVAIKDVKDEDKIIGRPTYAVEKLTKDELEVKFIYPIYPEVKIADYKNLKDIKLETDEFDPKSIDEEIEKLLENQSMLMKKDGSIENGDTVNFDFTGTVDGKEFDGGKAEKYDLEIGSNSFIPGFEEQMIGLNVGDEKDITVTFPEDYHAEDLKGKESVFKVKIHEVSIKEVPELTDEFVKSVDAVRSNTVEELKTFIEDTLKSQIKEKAKMKYQRAFINELKKDSEIQMPQLIVAQEMRSIEKEFTDNMGKQGMKIDDYLKATGSTREDLRNQFKSQAESRLSDAFIFAEIAKAEKIEITDKEYDAEYEKLAKAYAQPIEKIKEVITKAQLQVPLTNMKVIDAVLKYNNQG